jgi:hypothetical protein
MQLNARSRSKFAYVSALVVLQRTPMMPVAKHVTGLLGKVVGKLWSWKVAIPTLAGAGSFHALSGATTEVVGIDPNPANGTEGESYEFRWSHFGHEPESYEILDLPSGLNYNGSTRTPRITGILPDAGEYNISIIGWENFNRTGASTEPYNLVINVSAGNTAPELSEVSGQTTDEGTAKVVTLAATDLDGDNLTFTASSNVAEVSTSVSGDQLTLTPDPGYSGTATITVNVSDGNGGTDQITFDLVVTPAPTLWSDQNTTDLGGSWKSSTWFGLFYDNGNGWVYHADHGWLFIDGTDESAIWVYDGTLGWLFTSNALNQNLFYRQSTNTWYHFSNQGGVRNFYDHTAQQWSTVPKN